MLRAKVDEAVQILWHCEEADAPWPAWSTVVAEEAKAMEVKADSLELAEIKAPMEVKVMEVKADTLELAELEDPMEVKAMEVKADTLDWCSVD